MAPRSSSIRFALIVLSLLVFEFDGTASTTERFVAVSQGKNWADAQAHCESTYGTNLATAQDDDEYSQLVAMYGELQDFWVGLNDLEEEGIWGWKSGYECSNGNCDDLTWWHEETAEPNNAGDEDCAVVHLWGDTAEYEFADRACWDTVKFVCDGPGFGFDADDDADNDGDDDADNDGDDDADNDGDDDSPCDVSQCTATVYQDCQSSDHCGAGCAYLEDGIGDSGCAWNACSAVTGDGEWQNVCGGIDAIDIEGGCSLQMARDSDGGTPYETIFESGFHGVWMTYEDGVHFGDNVGSVKMFCADTSDPLPTPVPAPAHWIVAGRVDHSSWDGVPIEECAFDWRVEASHQADHSRADQDIAVSCCDDSDSGNRPGRRKFDSVTETSDGCAQAKTFDEAEAICTTEGLRLCTRSELHAKASTGKGCYHNVRYEWTSTSCDTNDVLLDMAAPSDAGQIDGATHSDEGSRFFNDFTSAILGAAVGMAMVGVVVAVIVAMRRRKGTKKEEEVAMSEVVTAPKVQPAESMDGVEAMSESVTAPKEQPAEAIDGVETV